jgi:NADPH-dependent 2,4-dienoyl-CoA reductase/sulfur reductase-like enzyme
VAFEFWILVAAPKGLFPPDPEKYTGPKLKVAIIGAGLAGMSTAVELLEQGHEVLVINFLLFFSYPIAFCFVIY